MAVWKSVAETATYDGSAIKKSGSPLEYLKRTNAIAAIRSERGYSATKYDASPARLPESLRRQFEQKYDGKKVRNMYSGTLALPA
jgi:hypothetical protein